MAVNKFLEFGSDCIDILSDEEYVENPTRSAGVQTGIASSTFHNKLFRQSSIVNAAIGQVVSDEGLDAGDESVEDLSAKIKTAFKQAKKITFDPGTLFLSTNVEDAIKEPYNYVDIVIPASSWSASLYTDGGQFVNPASNSFWGVPFVQSITLAFNIYQKKNISIRLLKGNYTVVPSLYPPVNPFRYETMIESQEYGKISNIYTNSAQTTKLFFECFYDKPMIDLTIRIEGV